MATRMQQRRGTASQWVSSNDGDGPILNAGEIGFETDTNKFKIGDGVSPWADLAYFADAPTLGGSIDDYIPLTQKGVANGVAELDAQGKLASLQIPNLDEITQDILDTALVAGTGLDKTYNDTAGTYTMDIDSTVATKTYADTAVSTAVSGLTKSSVGLGNVDNTSDANKPVSTATQTALDLKAPLASPTFTGTVTLPIGTVTSGMIADGTIVNADINASAAIDKTKISGTAITAGDTGTITSTMIADGTIVNADINASAAIALSKLATDPLARANHTGTQTASTISDFDTQVRTSKVTDLAAPTGSFSMNSQKITSLATPTADADAATKAYVDAATAGLNVHASVQAATTANVTLSSALENGDTLDGVTLATGNRVLVKNQTDKTQNGIYVVKASGTPDRADDYNTTPEVDAGDFIFVEAGTANGKTGWMQVNVVTTIGSDNIEFTQFSGAGTYTAGNGLTLTGSAFSINTSTTVDLNTAQTLTNKTLTSPTITGTGAIAGTFTGNLTGNVTGNVSGNAGTVTNGVYTTDTGTVTSTMIANGTIVDADINASAAVAQSKISGLTTDLAAKAPLASPTFTGTVTIPNGAALGTPTSLTLTNATGLPVASGISGLGTGVATFLATPTAANLASMVTDEIGSGSLMFSELPTSAQTASYTLVLADKMKIVEMLVASANNLTVPTNASVAFPVGSQINIVQTGSGQTTVVAAGGVTINTATTLKLRAQWSAATLIKRAENTWVLVGDLATS